MSGADLIARPSGQVPLSAREFAYFTALLRKLTGIELKDGKQSLVTGRLERRLRHHGLETYEEYFALLGRPEAPEETLIAIDLMTTNETYFFREPGHFDLLPSLVLETGPAATTARIWSAASSTGEEAYSIALTLAGAQTGRPWEVLGTDVSTRVVETARRGLYPLQAADLVPRDLVRAHCLRGRGEQAGLFTVRAELRRRVRFERVNLIRPLPDLGVFDVVFLRNAMIYFNNETKRVVLDSILARLRPGGYLLIGHAESLAGVDASLDRALELVTPSVYRRRED